MNFFVVEKWSFLLGLNRGQNFHFLFFNYTLDWVWDLLLFWDSLRFGQLVVWWTTWHSQGVFRWFYISTLWLWGFPNSSLPFGEWLLGAHYWSSIVSVVRMVVFLLHGGVVTEALSRMPRALPRWFPRLLALIILLFLLLCCESWCK